MLSFLIEIPHLGQLGFKMHLSYAKFVQPYPSDLGTLDREWFLTLTKKHLNRTILESSPVRTYLVLITEKERVLLLFSSEEKNLVRLLTSG